MNIEPGQTWIMRNGQRMVITALVPEDPMPVKAGKLCWQTNGLYWDDDVKHPMDLITLVENE